MVRNPVSRKEDAMQHTYLSASQKQYAAIVFAIAWLVQPSIAAAGAPLDALQATSQKVHTVLNDMELKKPERAVERRNQLV
jgi:hypothetical protein